MSRNLPNIIITGTPGTGKSSHVQQLKDQLDDLDGKFEIRSINDVAKEHGCFIGYDEELQTSIVDDDKLLDAVEEDLEKGGQLIDWHVCDIFPERLIDLVIVLRADTKNIYDRMKKRNYNDKKLQENMDAEIMEIILNEARQSYRPEIVIELPSNTVDDMDSNVDRIVNWIDLWRKDNAKS